MSDKLNMLLRENKGRKLLAHYKQLFIDAGLKDENLNHIPINDFDPVVKELKQFKGARTENEMFLKKILIF